MDCQHLHEIEGLQFMPVKENKMPIIKGWQTSELKHDLSNCAGVGLVCGPLSGNLEAVDVDSKYDLTGKLFEKFKAQIHRADNGLLSKLLVQKTKGGGYHLIYRCGTIQGNLKLANRHATESEKADTYKKVYEAEIINGDDDTAKRLAKKASDNDKVRVLLETRGTGGFIMCFPSKGYEIIHNDYYGISEITIEQRELILSIARSFNEVYDEPYEPKVIHSGKKTG